jgi:hypothetical protein
MQTGFWKKCLVLVIIILLMGISILPSMSGNVKKNNKKTVVDTNIKQTYCNNPPEEEWNKTYGQGSGYFVLQTSDNGYIITGERNGYACLIKTDSNGNEIWNKTYYYGTFAGRGYTVKETSDNGFFITGSTGPYLWIIKTNINGNEEWNNTFYPSVSYCGRTSGQQTSDGGYIVSGCLSSFLWLVKTDNNGYEEWNKNYYGIGGWGNFTIQTSDGGYIITGEDLLLKADIYGNEEWFKTYGTYGGFFGHNIQQTTDNGYIVVGDSYGGYGGLFICMYLLKTDNDGNKEWDRKFYGGPYYQSGWTVQQTIDGGYVLTGEIKVIGSGGFDAWLIKTDNSGIEEWNITFGGVNDDKGWAGQQTNDGGYIITGETKSFGTSSKDIWLIKVATDNNPPDEPIIFEDNDTLYIYSIDPDNDNIYFLIDWDDGTYSDWFGPYTSGEILAINHTWSEPGTYYIKAKAKDIYGAESNWSESFIVVIENKPPETPEIYGQ